jgi:hypothetical protein
MPSSSHLPARWRTGLHVVFAITILNYLAQIPYYIHFYGVYHVYPSPLGVVLLACTLALFLAGYIFTLQKRRIGWWLLVGFLLLEFGFYLLHNLTGAFLRDLPVNDPLFLAVSLIGYLNTVVALISLIVMIRARKHFLPGQPKAREDTAA